MTTGQKAIAQGLKVSNKIWGETFVFRGANIVGIPNSSVTQNDLLKYDVIPTNFVKIQICHDQIIGEKPKKGEYLYKGGVRFIIIENQDMGEPSNVYVLFCSGSEVESGN